MKFKLTLWGNAGVPHAARLFERQEDAKAFGDHCVAHHNFRHYTITKATPSERLQQRIAEPLVK